MYLQIVDPGPSQPVIAVDLALQMTRIDTHVDDNLVSHMLAVATSQVEKFLNRNLISRTITANFTHTTPPANVNYMTVPIVVYPLSAIMYISVDQNVFELPRAPVSNVVNVAVTHWSGNTVSLTEHVDYNVRYDSDPAQIKIYTHNTLDENLTFNIQYTAGYANATSIPVEAKHAILLQLTNLYQNRGDNDMGGGLCEAAVKTLYPIRNYGFGY